MPEPTSSSGASDARRLDARAVDAALRRLVRRPEAPWLHEEIARRMAQRLSYIRAQPEVVIDWWSTLGGGAALLDEAYPRARRIAVEPDARWAAAAAPRAPWWSARRWRETPSVLIDDAEIAGPAQLLWANMMLHAVVDPPSLFERWQRLLRVDGFVMFSCLGPGTLRELREIYGREGWPTPTPGYIDMHDLGDMLVDAGFADPVLDQETITLRWRSATPLLEELRQLGGNTAPDRFAGLRTRAWRDRLRAALEARADADGGIGLSVEVAYGHGFKPAPRLRAGAPVAVSLDDMRAMVRRPRPSS